MKHLMLALGILSVLATGLYADEVLYDCSQDTEVDEELSDMTAGEDVVIEVHADWEDDPVWQVKTLFQFPVAISDVLVYEAVLQLHVVGNNETDPGPLAIFRAGGSWNEMTATWNTRPSENRDIEVIETEAPQGSVAMPGLWEIDVTDIVQSWVDGSPNNGFYIDVPDNNNWVGVELATKEYPDADIHPKLWINYFVDACEENEAGDVLLDVPGFSEGPVKVCCSIPLSSSAVLSFYDVSGSLVKSQQVSGGDNTVTWNPSRGVYFVRLATSSESATRKLVVR